MASKTTKDCRWLLGLVALACAMLAGGCVDSAAYRLTSSSPPFPARTNNSSVRGAKLGTPSVEGPSLHPLSATARAEEAFSLQQLLSMATQQHPELASARARADAARGKLIQAGLYPNPTFSWLASQLLHQRNAAGEQGPLFAQQIVTADKLRLAQNAAAHGVAAAEWQAMTRWFDVVTRVRLAYYEVLTSQEAVKASEEVVRLADEGHEAAKKLLKGGAGTQPDVLQAKVELNQSKQRLQVARTRAEAAWKMLAVAVGVPRLPPAPLEEKLDGPVPHYEWQPTLERVQAHSSEVQEAHANVLQAQEIVRRQRAERTPDLKLGIQPYYAFQDQDKRLAVELGTSLPIFNRNQGNIHAAQAELVRTRQEVLQVELRLSERLTASFQRYRAAREQTVSYEKDILPDAAESLRLVRLGYERGDPKYDYATLLQAQRTLANARLAYVQALGDLRRAAAEIAGLLQED